MAPSYLRKTVVLLLLIAGCSISSWAQDTLPRISVTLLNKKVIVSWKNTYGARIATLNIQRSTDSLKRFTTIGSVLNPTARENGYVDTKAPDSLQYYRVFVAFEGGQYFFSKSMRPVKDSLPPEAAETALELLPPPTEDVSAGKPTVAAFVPSKWVFTGKDNNLVIQLPEAGVKTYSLRIFNADSVLLFQLATIKEPFLILEKSNFMRAGWYHYELLENGKPKESHKFYIAREGNKGVILPAEKKQLPR